MILIPGSSFRAKREIFVIHGQGLTFSPYVPRTSPLSSSIFLAARTLSGSLRSPPSPCGEGCGSGDSVYFYLLPLEGGAPKGRRLAPQRYERECERVRFPVSSSRAEPRDLFRLRVSFFLCESVCMKHRSFQFIWSMAFPVIRCSRILGLTANGKDFSLSLEMTIWGKRYSPFSSLVPSHQPLAMHPSCVICYNRNVEIYLFRAGRNSPPVVKIF